MPRLEILEDRTALSTLTVLNNHDGGAGSLRHAIAHAQDGDTIVFDPGLEGQVITLTSGQVAINKNLDIEGPGASELAISGNDANRIFKINAGFTVTIAGLTLTRGHVVGPKGGAAILNAGTLAVGNDVLSFNQADNLGGAIYDLAGSSLTATGSTFYRNQVVGQDGAFLVEGGAISSPNDGIAPTTLIGCAFIENRAVGGNGGVFRPTAQNIEFGGANGGAIHSHTSLTIIDSIFIGNQAIAGSGGSVGKANGPYVLDVGSGGAIADDDGTMSVSGCTFWNNQAIGGSNAVGLVGQGRIGHAIGGAIQNNSTLEATITNSTFDHNEALGGSNNTGGSGALIVGRAAGGAVGNYSFDSPVALAVSNCTFTNNRAVGGANNSGAAFVSDGIGGALLNERGAIATVTGSSFIGNLALGGQRGDASGADGLGGGIANFLGSPLTINNCTLTGNQAIGGAGGTEANGGNGFGGGIFNDGLSIWPTNVGTPATLTVLGSTVTGNQATGGSAGAGGSAGQGVGGGAYFATFGTVCLDAFTLAHLKHNHASTSNDDIFGDFTTCP